MDDKLEQIGNNVTLEYEEMNFGKEGTCILKICGRTPLPRNTIHLRFTTQEGDTVNRMVEFRRTNDYEEQSFPIEKLMGKGKLAVIFLPGSQFDLAYLQWQEVE